jgi:hypothetical protein
VLYRLDSFDDSLEGVEVYSVGGQADELRDELVKVRRNWRPCTPGTR